MTKIIYSLYIDIPEEELDGGIPYYGEKESKSIKTKLICSGNCSGNKDSIVVSIILEASSKSYFLKRLSTSNL